MDPTIRASWREILVKRLGETCVERLERELEAREINLSKIDFTRMEATLYGGSRLVYRDGVWRP